MVAGSPLAGQAPGVITLRLSGALPGIAALASLFGRRGTGTGLIEVSQPYPNRRGAGRGCTSPSASPRASRGPACRGAARRPRPS
jgi:hypothetical protein